MEVLSGTASLLSVLQLAGAIVERGFCLYQQIQDAPAELEAARNCLVLVRAELIALAGLDAGAIDRSLNASAIPGLEAALAAAGDALKLTEVEINRFPASLRFRGRVRWAMLDRRRSEKILRHLRSTESSLVTVLVLLLMRNQNANFAAIKTTLATTQTQAVTNTLSLPPAASRTKKPRGHTKGRSAGSQSNTYRALVHAAIVGFRATVVRTRWIECTDWFISLQQHLPFAHVFGATILQIRLHLYSNILSRGLSLRNGSGVAFARLVGEDNALIVACKSGDIEAARRTLGAKEGFLTDTTAEPAWTPLAWAIESGNLELVRLLLDCGADLDWTVGSNQTSPLQLALWCGQTDIARLLVRRGANTEYRSAHGVDLPYFAWSAGRPVPDLEVTIKMLHSENGLDQLNEVDINGWTCLHHIAVYGSAGEVELMLRLGADPLVPSEPLGWNALQHSIYYDNWQVYSVLKQCCGPGILRFTDARGWTLLHLAAATGTCKLIQDLLCEGADMNALTEEATELVVPSLFRKRCSPADIAINGGYSAAFSEAVESYCAAQGLLVRHADDHEIEIFHDSSQ